MATLGGTVTVTPVILVRGFLEEFFKKRRTSTFFVDGGDGDDGGDTQDVSRSPPSPRTFATRQKGISERGDRSSGVLG